jgi:uncharacterized protein with beta-barrel porin domain
VAVAFAGETTPFVVTGVSLAEDSLLFGGKLELAIGVASRLSVSYAGEVGDGVQQNAIQGGLSVRF